MSPHQAAPSITPLKHKVFVFEWVGEHAADLGISHVEQMLLDKHLSSTIYHVIRGKLVNAQSYWDPMTNNFTLAGKLLVIGSQ
jgi:hypothetical protein